MRRALVLAAVLAFAPVPAYAQEPPAPPAAGPEVDAARLEDPNLDRCFFLPTAETQPQGALAFNNYELLFLGLSYGVTDRFQVTGTALAPIVTGMPTLFLGNVKYQALRSGSVRLALTAGFGYVGEETFDTPDSSSSGVFAGAVASRCLSEDCHSLASFSLSAGRGFSDDDDADGLGLAFGGSLVKRVSRRTKLLFEVVSGASFDPAFEMLPGALLSYGIRFFGSDIAGDVGFVRPVGEDTGEFLLGLPFINFTYRWRP